MPSSPISFVIWFLGPLVQLTTLVVMLRRGLHKKFHYFTTYTAYQALGTLLLFSIYRFGKPEMYFFAYWVHVALVSGLGFFVIKEAFENMLQPYAGLRDAAVVMFRWAAALLVLMSVVSYASGSGSGLSRIVREITVLERNVLLIQCGLLLFVVLCSNYLNISWKSFPCGIAFGFGIYACNDLVVSNMFLHRGWLVSNNTVILISQVVFLISSALWLTYSLLPAATAVAKQMVFRPVVDRWNQAAMLIMNSEGVQPADHSYLSDIERTVEAVMAHSSK